MEPSDRVYSHSSIVHYQIHHLAGLIADRNVSCSNRTVVKDVYRLVSSCLSLWYTYKTHLKNIMFELTERKKNKLTTMFVSNFGRVESNLPFPLHGSGLQQTDEGIEHRGWTSLTILTFSLKIHVQQLIHLHGIFFSNSKHAQMYENSVNWSIFSKNLQALNFDQINLWIYRT